MGGRQSIPRARLGRVAGGSLHSKAFVTEQGQHCQHRQHVKVSLVRPRIRRVAAASARSLPPFCKRKSETGENDGRVAGIGKGPAGTRRVGARTGLVGINSLSLNIFEPYAT